MAEPFYEHYGIYPRLKEDKRTLVEELFKRPPKITPDHIHVSVAGAVQQADLLHLPLDGKFEYALVAVDLATRACDAEPIPDRSAASTLAAFKTMYERGPLTIPQRLELDGGSEFKAEVGKFFRDRKVTVRVSVPGRHRQQSMVENLNRILGNAIFKRQIAQELATGEQSVEWVSDLPKFIGLINAKLVRAPPPEIPPDAPMSTGMRSKYILAIGTRVRVRLNRPQSVLGEKLHGTFRAHDIKFDPVIRTIVVPLLIPGSIIRYMVSGIKNASYSESELQVVSDPEPIPDKVKRTPEPGPTLRRSERIRLRTSHQDD